jgi:hypothetical protein
MIEIKNFKNNPILKDLLIEYIYRTYEDDAIIDDDHLMMEYRLLIRENRLNDLFIEEYLQNYIKYGNEFRG